MFDFIKYMLSFDFLVKALIVGVLVSLCTALLGSSLVLKRFSMIGDGLSHVAFGSVAIAVSLNWAPLWFAIPVVVVTAILLLRLSQKSKIKGDALIAMISSSALALGLIIISVSEVQFDLNAYMFGSILALTGADVTLSVICSVVVLILYIFFYNRLFTTTFDEAFSKATGTNSAVYNTFLAILTAVIIVVGMQLMGSLLISSLVIFPSLTAMRVCRSFRSVTICSAVVSVAAFCIGLVITFIHPVPTGPCIVAVNLVIFLLFFAVGKLREIRR